MTSDSTRSNTLIICMSLTVARTAFTPDSINPTNTVNKANKIIQRERLLIFIIHLLLACQNAYPLTVLTDEYLLEFQIFGT